MDTATRQSWKIRTRHGRGFGKFFLIYLGWLLGYITIRYGVFIVDWLCTYIYIHILTPQERGIKKKPSYPLIVKWKMTIKHEHMHTHTFAHRNILADSYVRKNTWITQNDQAWVNETRRDKETDLTWFGSPAYVHERMRRFTRTNCEAQIFGGNTQP